MNDKEQKIYDYIKEFIEDHGYSPTTREIGYGMDIKSSSSVNFYLKKLKNKWYINYVETSPRTITLVGYNVKLMPNLPNED